MSLREIYSRFELEFHVDLPSVYFGVVHNHLGFNQWVWSIHR